MFASWKRSSSRTALAGSSVAPDCVAPATVTTLGASWMVSVAGLATTPSRGPSLSLATVTPETGISIRRVDPGAAVLETSAVTKTRAPVSGIGVARPGQTQSAPVHVPAPR